MGRNIDEVIKSLPVERQRKVSALTQQKVDDMLAHAATLTDFRKAVGKTQAEVAKALGINQNAVSQLERRSDTYVSTLRRFLKSLGLTLELSVVDKNGVRVELPNFFRDSAGVPAEEAASPPLRRKRAPKLAQSTTSPKKAVAAQNVPTARRATRD